MTKEETAAFVERIRSANREAIESHQIQVEEWKAKFPEKPLPWHLKSFRPNRFEPFLRKLEREAGL